MSLDRHDCDWKEYKVFIIEFVRSNDGKYKEIIDELAAIKKEVTQLQMKSGIWGLMGGLIPVLIALLVQVFFK